MAVDDDEYTDSMWMQEQAAAVATVEFAGVTGRPRKRQTEPAVWPDIVAAGKCADDRCSGCERWHHRTCGAFWLGERDQHTCPARVRE